jgi:predicted CoA-binding protein
MQQVNTKDIKRDEKTLILGASTNPSRYSNKAANMLHKHGHAIVNIGLSGGSRRSSY